MIFENLQLIFLRFKSCSAGLRRNLCWKIGTLFIKLNIFLIASDALISNKVSLGFPWYRHLCVKNIRGTSVMIFFCYARQIGMSYTDRRLILSSKLEESLKCSFPLRLFLSWSSSKTSELSEKIHMEFSILLNRGPDEPVSGKGFLNSA